MEDGFDVEKGADQAETRQSLFQASVEEKTMDDEQWKDGDVVQSRGGWGSLTKQRGGGIIISGGNAMQTTTQNKAITPVT